MTEINQDINNTLDSDMQDSDIEMDMDCSKLDDEPISTSKRTRRRRRRRGGGRRAPSRAHWWSFAPHPKDDDGNVIKAGKNGYPVVLPSGQSVFLLHEAKNPEYAQTFLAEDKYRPAMPAPPTVITEDDITSSEDDEETVSTPCTQSAIAAFDKLMGSISSRAKISEEMLEDDFEDSMSSCSELSTESSGLAEFFCTSVSGAATIIKRNVSSSSLSSLESDLGSTDASDSSSNGASSASWSTACSSVASSDSRGSQSFGKFHEFEFMPDLGDVWSFDFDDVSFLAQYSKDIDRLVEDAPTTDECLRNDDGRPSRKEERRLRKLKELGERKLAMKNRRRAEHERRERRNRVKQQRRVANSSVVTSEIKPADEVDEALRELGLI